MKKLIVVALLIAAFSFTADAQFKFGAGASLIVDGPSIGAGAKGHYTVNEDFAAQGSFHYYFEDFTAWQLDLDVHYNGLDSGDVEGFQLAPFAGLNFAHVSVLGFGATNTNINLGLNGTLPMGGLEIYIEPKIVLGGGSAFLLGAGVYF